MFLFLYYCSSSSTTNTRDTSIIYEKKSYTLMPGVSDTIDYFGVLQLILPSLADQDTLRIDIDRTELTQSVPSAWNRLLISFSLAFFRSDSSTFSPDTAQVDVWIKHTLVEENLDPFRLVVAERAADTLAALTTMIDYRQQSVWTRLEHIPAQLTLGELLEVDSASNGVALELPLTANGFAGLSNYKFPEDVPVYYQYPVFHTIDENTIETPLFLRKTRSVEIPLLVVSFYCDDESKDFRSIWASSSLWENHARKMIDALQNFGPTYFDGIHVDYAMQVDQQNCAGYLDFVNFLQGELAGRWPNKTFSFALPWFLLTQLQWFENWNNINSIQLRVWPQNSRVSREQYQPVDFVMVTNEWIRLQSMVKSRKIYWQLDPTFFYLSQDSIARQDTEAFFRLLDFKISADSLQDQDTLQLSSSVSENWNALASQNTLIQWSDTLLSFVVALSNQEKLVVPTEKGLDWQTEFVHRLNFGGLVLSHIDVADSWSYSSRLKNFFYRRFYPESPVTVEDFQLSVQYRQKIYNAAHQSADSLFPKVKFLATHQINPLIEAGVKRGDSLSLFFQYSLNTQLILKDTAKGYIYNGSPYSNYSPPYSHSIHAVFEETVQVSDPDNDVINYSVKSPEDAHWSDGILKWQPTGQASGSAINFELEAADRYSHEAIRFSLLLTDRSDSLWQLANGQSHTIVSPEVVYLPSARTFIGSDSAYQIVQWVKVVQNNITYYKPLAAKFLAWMQYMTALDSVAVTRHNPIDTAFFKDTIAFLPGDTIFQPLRTSFYQNDETPIEEEYLGNFYASVYEVSNEEYSVFVSDSGYSRADWWSPDGWLVVQDSNWKYPLDWSAGGNYSGTRSPLADGPVTGVSWYEADAYARWLSSKLGESWRLPTEEEWERMACGPAYLDTLETEDYRISYPWRDYPWKGGMNWDNLAWGYNDTVFAVGQNSYRSGATPEGICHLLGNALEWTVSPYHSPRSIEPSDKMTLKGASIAFRNYGTFFHNKVRFRLNPYERRKDTGFRLVKP